uniref:Replication timing regulatory factor 1 n=1 Tax=Nothoprocta perdicaria TaxID=30464 RepID=A0A8C6ZZN8_NOTPE
MSAPSAAPSLLPLLETLEEPAAPPGDVTDALLTVEHISSQNSELSNAALQALGFCVFNSKITSELSEVKELLSAVNNIAVKTSDKNTRTRALWVISKQTFPSEIVGKEVSSILSTLEAILTKGDVPSMVVEYEALNVVIRLVEQAPAQMGEEAVRWAKLIIPLVVHSAHKVQLRGATALEMGMPLLLQKQQEVAALTEHLMTTKLITELQKLFSTKNETYVLKLWPLFVKLLGKTLHRSGSFINSLLQLEELGFRSGSPVVKKIAFIAWKSLIDNFALNPDILCSAKRLKLLMQPLSSIHVRTEALALTKLEVWWYLLMRLGPQLPANFEQVCVPLIQSTLSLDSSAALQGTPSHEVLTNAIFQPPSPAPYPFGSPATPRMNLSSGAAGMVMIPSIQLLGIEMLLHFLRGPEVLNFAKENKLVLSLEPLQYPLISSPSFFCKHASTLINAVQDGFIAIGKEKCYLADSMLNVIWQDVNGYVKTAIESGNKKEKQGSEVLTMLLQTLKNIVRSNSLPMPKVLSLIDITVKELPAKVLGSPAYQIADMDLLNGTPALFLIQLPFHNNLLEQCVTDERFFIILETLVGCVLSGPTSLLAFSESLFCIINQSAKQVENKEHLWRMWSVVVNPLTEWINRTNEVNQGDALEHNFSAVYSALLLPVFHIFPVPDFPQPTMKSLLHTWSDLYRAFARCAALVATAEENVCCEELCAKIISGLEEGLTHVMSVVVDCINFAPYGTKYQPKIRSPQTPTDWSKKKKEPLGKLAPLFKILVMLANSFHAFSSKEICSETLVSVGSSIIAILHNIISHVSLPSVIGTMFAMFSKPLSVFYEKTKLADVPKAYNNLNSKLEKLLAEIILCLQSHCTGSFDSELLKQLSPLLCTLFQHKSKQIRNQCANFWNATFAKATSLTYPEELKAVLTRAKQKTPLLLPGFESVEIAEEYSGPFSDAMENSQWDTKISGMEVKSARKRDSLLAQTSELKNELKLEFSSVKTRSEIDLEEEKSADFVFIPPEAKARVLTEHQKEVLRSKRSDIPAMYNNLDTSQDTTLFSQYTQSQEESFEGCLDEPDPSSGEELEKSAVEAASNEASAAGRENTSNVSSSSTSSDVISGTPQPASRRQSFITLEKFDSSEHRPFSVSALSSLSEVPGKAAGSEKQENTNKSKVDAKAEKCGEESKNASKPESEEIVTAIRRLTRRQSKIEQQGNKQPKLSTKADKEKSSQEPSVPVSMENNPELVEETERVLLAQSQALRSTDAEIKKIEDTLAEMEKIRALDADSKENKPPESTAASDQVAGVDNQVPHVSPNPKALRRSLRRRSEPTEGAAGSQDKENSHQKKDKRKEDEKSAQKKGPQIKDDVSQKQKAAEAGNKAEDNAPERAAAEGSGCRESCAPRGPEEEENRSARRPEDASKADTESQDASSDVAAQKVVRERPRYHTRRASQGLLSSIENSEADSCEVKEENTRKKRSGKVKNDALEVKLKEQVPEGHGHEVSSQETERKAAVEVNSSELSCEASTDAAASPEAQSAEGEQTTTAGLAESVSNPRASEQALKAAEENKCAGKRKSAEDPSSGVPPEPVAGAHAAGAGFSPSQIPECQHKRSKRTRRARSCDCCVKAKQQLKSLSEIKVEIDTELSESPATPTRAAPNTSEMSGDSNLEESLPMAPCAMSTPLLPTAESSVLSSPGETESKESLQGNCVAAEEDLEGDAARAAGGSTEPVVEAEEPLDQRDTGEPRPAEPAAPAEPALREGDSHEAPLEEAPLEEAPAAASPAGQREMEEQEAEEHRKDEISVGEPFSLQDAEMKEELIETEIQVPENVTLDQEGAEGNSSVESPEKPKDLDPLVLINESPTGVQARSMWSPSASPSTSILKRGVKRNQDDDSLSPANKIRRVSFANPIYQEGLADDIDRRSPVVRSHSSNGSPSSRSLKILSNIQPKHITTPTKGFLSPGFRNLKFKSSKKCLITEMSKESLPCLTERVYPALVGCKAPVDIILPQITSNICARGLGQLIRAKNIKTVGDLSTLTASEIKTLPIRSPKVSNVRKALKGYHEQQVKSRGLEEITALEDAEKPINSTEDKSFSGDEEKLATDLVEPVVLTSPPAADLLSQVEALAARLSAADLHSYPGSQLFEMQEKLVGMTNCIMKNLQARWKSPPHESFE